MNAFLTLLALLIITDTIAALIGAFVLYRYHSSSFIRAMATLLGAFALEQCTTLIAISIDPVRVKHIKAYYALILGGRLVRSIGIWRFTLPLFGVIRGGASQDNLIK